VRARDGHHGGPPTARFTGPVTGRRAPEPPRDSETPRMRPSGMNMQFWEVSALLRNLRYYLVNVGRFFTGWSVTEIPPTELPRPEDR
jgi:hypothetical protein